MIRVGTAGWSYEDWKGVVYPRSTPRGFHPLRFLAPYMDCVEVNSSFYRLPLARNAVRWVECVEEHPGFRFVSKLHQGFTHEPPRRTAEMEADVRAFREGVGPLADAGRLAGLLAQFPHSFVPAERAWGRLRWIADSFGDLGLVVELRRREWFTPESVARLAELGVSLAGIDLPAADTHPPDDVPHVGPTGYLRLHGRNARAWFDPRAGRDQKYDYLYAADEVRALVERAKRLAEGRDETYVITNNHFSGQALVNAIQLSAELAGGPPRAPETLAAAYPGLVEPAGGGGLWS